MKLVLFQTAPSAEVMPGAFTGRGVVDISDAVQKSHTPQLTMQGIIDGCGGYIAGSAELIEYLKNNAGAFVYSVAVPPVIAEATLKALEIMHREPERVTRLQYNGMAFRELAKRRGLDTGTGAGTAIYPIIKGDSLPAAVLPCCRKNCLNAGSTSNLCSIRPCRLSSRGCDFFDDHAS